MSNQADQHRSAPTELLSVLGLTKGEAPAVASVDELRHFRAGFRALVNSLPLNLMVKDAHGRRVLANQSYLDLHGATLAQLVGKTDADLYPEEVAEQMRAQDDEVLKSGRVFRSTEKLRTPNGQEILVERIKGPVRDADGNIVGVQVLFWDVTDRLNAETALHRERALMDCLMESIPDSIYFKDRESRFLRLSRSMAEKLGLPEPDSALGMTDADVFTAEHARQAREDELRVIETGEPIVAQIEKETWPDREDTWCSTTKMPLRDKDGVIVGTFGISRDVTDIKRAEESLHQERDLLRTLMDSLPDLVFVKDREGRFITVNNAIVELYHVNSPEDLVGKTDFDFTPPEIAQAFADDDQSVMRSNEALMDREESHIDADGNPKWVLTTKVPMRNASGQVIGLVGIARDITKLKQTEIALREARSAADAANRAKSDFLANMSHEIRTPMNAIIGMTELLLDTKLTQTQREYLGMVQQSGDSLLELLNDILDFSKIEAGRLELDSAPFDIREALGDTMKSLALRAHGKGLELAFAIHSDVPFMMIGDFGRLRQIVVNLIGNAIKFTELGEIVLDVTCDSISDDAVTLIFQVRDTGIGIPPEKLEHIFEKFQQADTSTTRSYGGTGLGLAISSRLSELMGGRTWVESEVGTGSTFYFSAKLRICHDTPDERARKHASLTDTPVLVVDDNATNRRILFDMLSNWGLKPTLATGAREAFERLEDAWGRRAPFKLVILDVNMPDVDGFEFASWVRDGRGIGQTPIVMLTSSGRKGDAERRSAMKIDAHLLKPVKQSELFDVIVSVWGVTAAEDESEEDIQPLSESKIHSLRILLAEDNVVNQKLAVGVLRKLGHSITVAENGKAAISAWETEPFDVILMDVQMPEMDGLEATGVIREREKGTGRHIPIIAMTAHAMKGDRERCLEAGMDEYLSKPIRIRQVTERLETVLCGSEAEDDGDSSGSDTIIDWQSALELTEGDRELLKIVAETFCQDARLFMEKIRASVSAGNAALLKDNAHALKGAMLAVGAKRSSATAFKLERIGNSGDLTDASPTLQILEEQMSSLLVELEKGPPDVNA